LLKVCSIHQSFFLARECLDEATARRFLDAIARYRDPETGKLKGDLDSRSSDGIDAMTPALL
jgi:hypothetical protein